MQDTNNQARFFVAMLVDLVSMRNKFQLPLCDGEWSWEETFGSKAFC